MELPSIEKIIHPSDSYCKEIITEFSSESEYGYK